MNATVNVGHVRVLVVEDDVDMRRAIREVFQMRGFAVNTAGDGQAALNLAAVDDYDVVVTDVRMPGITGIDLTRRILARRPSSKVIVITAFPEWKVCQEARAAGASMVMTKPITLATLAEAVEQLVEPRAAVDDRDYGGEA